VASVLVAYAPAPLPAEASAELAAAQTMAAQRAAITSKLRDAATHGNAALLREAIAEAEAAGLTHEANLGKRRLVALSDTEAPPPEAAPPPQRATPVAAASAATAAPVASAPAPPSAAFDVLTMAAQRAAITSKLREAATHKNAALLLEAIAEAEAAGLTHEANLGKRRLATLA
jgi:hypothetical protein